MKSNTKNTQPSAAEQLAHQALVDERAQLAMVVGTFAFILNTLEPWLAHDSVAAKRQLTVSMALIAITVFSYSRRKGKHRLTLFTLGFLIAIAGFHLRALNLSYSVGYSAGFPIFFAMYCVFIPGTVLRSALTGLLALAIVTIPDIYVTGRMDILLRILVSNSAPFFLLLYWRHIANAAWEGEFRARERERELISMISDHDIRTPLSTLCLVSENLEAGHVPDDELRKHYHALAEESRRLLRAFKSLLEFSRIGKDTVDYAFQVIDSVELVRQVVDEFEHEFSALGYRVDLQIGDETLLILGNRAAMQTVVWNLLDNAMKYSPTCRTVWVSVQAEVANVAIRVQDHGLGIPQTELPYMFMKFVRGETAKKLGITGTGVGLAIVKHIVEAHQGEIRVESVAGEGSAFTVLLPRLE